MRGLVHVSTIQKSRFAVAAVDQCPLSVILCPTMTLALSDICGEVQHTATIAQVISYEGA